MSKKEKSEKEEDAKERGRDDCQAKEPRSNQPPGSPPDASEKKEKTEDVTIARKEYEDLMGRLKELEGVRENLLRSAADFENAKKRLAREREEFIKFGQEGLIREILPVLDNFERALTHARESNDQSQKGVVTGIERVLKQLADILKNRGLKRLETVGKKFNPHMHEAIGYVEEEGQEEEILDEVETGYFLHDRLLRAAKVRVRIAPASKSENPPNRGEEKEEEIT